MTSALKAGFFSSRDEEGGPIPEILECHKFLDTCPRLCNMLHIVLPWGIKIANLETNYPKEDAVHE
jgi:hypothetical protein